jgi:hypothetical protein
LLPFATTITGNFTTLSAISTRPFARLLNAKFQEKQYQQCHHW